MSAKQGIFGENLEKLQVGGDLRKTRTLSYLAGLISEHASLFLGSVIGLLLTPFILKQIGTEGYGVFLLANDTVSWLVLIDLGLTGSLSVHLARQSSHSNARTISQYASSTFFSQLGVALVIAVAGIGISLVFPAFFDVPQDLHADTVLLLLLLTLGLALNYSTRAFRSVLVSQQHIYFKNLSEMLRVVSRSIFILVFLVSGAGLISLGFADIFATSLASGLLIYAAFRHVPHLSIKAKYVSWELILKVGKIGIWFSLGALSRVVIYSLDRTVAGKIVSLEAVTLLVLTGRLYYLARPVFESFSANAQPAIGQLLGDENRKQALEVARQLFILSNGITILISLSIWSANRQFVLAWIGRENYGGELLDTTMALSIILTNWVSPHRVVLSAAMMAKEQTLIRLIEAALNIALSLLLTMEFGLIGVALSTCLATLLTSFWMFPLLVAKLFRQSIWNHWTHDVPRLLFFFIAMFFVAQLGRQLGSYIGGFPGAFMSSSLTLFVGGLILWRLTIDRDMRLRILSVKKRLALHDLKRT